MIRLRTIFPALAVTVLSAPAQAASLFITCDNGLRCVRSPCPSYDAIEIPSGERYSRILVDINGLGARERARSDLPNGLYRGSLAFSGAIERGASVVNGRSIPTTTLRVTRIARTAMASEALLCRRDRS